MTVEQIAKLRDFNLKDDGTGNPIATVLSYIFNNELAYVNTRDFVITDDANQLIHAIKANIEDPINQARYPFKIMTGFYGNIQYMEALYNMENFKKAIKGLFVDSGLIDAQKEKMILNWANGIRNQTAVPKAPGPYFKDTILPISSTPVEERRADGLYHASAVHMPTLLKKIDDIIIPAIDKSNLGAIKTSYNHYSIVTSDTSKFANEFKTIIEAMGDDLYMASLTDNDKTAAVYDKKNQRTIDNFITEATKVIPGKIGEVKTLTLYIEAYNTRCDYIFRIWCANEEEVYQNWISSTETYITKMNRLIELGTGTLEPGTYVSETIYEYDTKPTADDIKSIIDVMLDMPNVAHLSFSANNNARNKSVYTKDNIDEAVNAILDMIPAQNTDKPIRLTIELVSVYGVSIKTDLYFNYYNKSECACISSGGTYFTTLHEACSRGGIFTLVNDVVENVIIPEGKTVVIELNDYSITNKEDKPTIHNMGHLTIKGNGMVDNTANDCPALFNDAGAKCDIHGGTFTRSEEAGTDASNDNGNSYYVIKNYGDMAIGTIDGDDSDVTIGAEGGYSSVVANDYYDTSNIAANTPYTNMTIHHGTFYGGLNTIKNDELGVLIIFGGEFTNENKCVILNWNECYINGGIFHADGHTHIISNNKINTRAIGKLVISNGSFSADEGSCIDISSKYNSEDITIFDGTFSDDVSKYIKNEGK